MRYNSEFGIRKDAPGTAGDVVGCEWTLGCVACWTDQRAKGGLGNPARLKEVARYKLARVA